MSRHYGECAMWKDKPALFAAFVMAAGFIAARISQPPPEYWALCATACLITAAVVLIRSHALSSRSVLQSFTIPLFLFFASALWYASDGEFGPEHLTHYLRLGRPVQITAVVLDEPVVRSGRTTVLIDCRSICSEGDTAMVEGRALLTVAHIGAPADSSEPGFSYGDRITFAAIPEEPQDTRNPGEVSYRDHCALNNVYAVMRVRDARAITVIEKGNASWFFENLIFPAKHFVARSIAGVARGEERHYLTGLLLGDRSDLSRETQQAFANTGTVHVLAVSGSHVVVVVAAIYALFGMLRMPSRAKLITTMAAILFYMLLTGSTPSVVRASLMGCVVLCARLFQRRSSVYNCLGISAILMFLYDPKQVFDVGFQLSFAAVFAMVFCYPRMAALTGRIPKTTRLGRLAVAAAELTAVSAAAQIGTIPFTAYYFEKISLISLAANLFVVPLAGLNILLGFVGILFSIVSAWAGSCFTEVNVLLTRGVLAIVKTSNRIPHAILHTASFGAKESVIYVLATAMLFAMPRPALFRKLFLGLFFAADCLMIADAFTSARTEMRMTIFDVGQGDAMLIEIPGADPVMIDAGGRSAAYDAGERIIVPGLRRRGVSALSNLIISHAHDDHIGGLHAVLSEVPADRLVGSSAASALMRTRTGIPAASSQYVRIVGRGDTIAVHPALRLYVLHPPAAQADTENMIAEEALNDASVVVKVCCGSVAFLLMGDAGRAVEHELAERYGDFLRSTVIKLGHHGSGSSSTEELLQAVRPVEAVVSVGRFNPFRHPSPATIRRARHLGIAVHRTDREGAVVFETDGRELRRIAWREEEKAAGILR